jgi:formylglycine-generating enzyme required for sulfatase activity
MGSGPLNDEPVLVDALERTALVATVARAAATWDPPLTIGVYGPWGEGKTSTLRMIQGALDERARDEWLKNHKEDQKALEDLTDRVADVADGVAGTVWYDPWKYQFEDTPISSFIRTLAETAESGRWGAAAKGLFQDLREIVGCGLAEIFWKNLTNVSLKDIQALREELGRTKVLAKSFTDVLNDEYKRAVRAFVGNGRLVVFIDDLDRCQPEYVVKMLEALKLALLCPQCVYVLGVDEQKVADAIRYHYKKTLSESPDERREAAAFGRSYLEKIVQLPVRLPAILQDSMGEFVANIVGEKSIIREDGAIPKGVAEMLRLGLERRPRHAKRFVMLLEFGLALAAETLGEELTPGDRAVICKLQLVQYRWPGAPRDVDGLLEMENFMSKVGAGSGAASMDREEGRKKLDEIYAGMVATPEDHLRLRRFRRFYDALDDEARETLRQVLETEPQLAGLDHERLEKLVHLAASAVAATTTTTTPAPPEELEDEWDPDHDFHATVTSNKTGDELPTEASEEQRAYARETALPLALRLDAAGTKLRLVLIPPGEFTMGDDNGAPDEKPAHPVRITRPFYLGIHQVTQAQYEAVMGRNPSHFREGGANRPVESVSWFAAEEFCRRLTEKTGQEWRLPTEAEWEYACRAGSRTQFCNGDEESGLNKVAWYLGNSQGRTHSVGELDANAWGLYDMHGNVFEWCQDWGDADYYSKSPKEDPTGPSAGSSRVYRGGCWLNPAPVCRSANRLWDSPTSTLDYLGFRVVVWARTP